MRCSITVLLALVLCTAQAQRLSLSNILLLTSCLDTTCMGAFANSAGFCNKLGKDEDGWIWFSCAQVFGDSLDEQHVTTIGFTKEGFGNRVYSIGTGDTAYAQELTEELGQLHFIVEKPLPEGQLYRNSAYPNLEIRRLEKRMTSIERRGPTIPNEKSRPKPMDERERQMREDIAKSHPEWGDFDLVPKISWVFKVVVKPD